MKDLAEYIIKQLVNNTEEVSIEEENSEEGLTLFVRVAPDDMGLIIGKGGATIKAIRKVLTIRAMADRVRVNIRLVEDNPQAACLQTGVPHRRKATDRTFYEPCLQVPFPYGNRVHWLALRIVSEIFRRKASSLLC